MTLALSTELSKMVLDLTSRCMMLLCRMWPTMSISDANSHSSFLSRSRAARRPIVGEHAQHGGLTEVQGPKSGELPGLLDPRELPLPPLDVADDD